MLTEKTPDYKEPLIDIETCWDFTLSATCSRSFKECVCFVSGTGRLF